jgi:hypothetical protein
MKRCLSLCLVLCLGWQLGCSKAPARPATFPVTGTVKWKGAALEGAQVHFVPKDPAGQVATGVTDATGKYTLGTYGAGDGAQAGEYLIKVVKTDAKMPTPAGSPQTLSHEAEQAAYVEGAPVMEAPKSLIPKKYDSEHTSGLTHTVPQSPTTFDIVVE